MAEYIEREALLEALENADPDVYEDYGDGTVDWGFGRKNIQDMINGIPAADVVPVVHWVPVNEDLPPDGQYVLCWYEYFRYGEYNRMYQTFGIGYQFHGIWGGEVARGSKTRVLAWMPLPNPPEMDGGADHAAD